MSRICILYCLVKNGMEGQVCIINNVDDLKDEEFYFIARSKFDQFIKTKTPSKEKRSLKALFIDPEYDIADFNKDYSNAMVLKWDSKSKVEYCPLTNNYLTTIL